MPLTEADIARLEALGHRREDFAMPGEHGWLQLRTRDAPAGTTTRPCVFLRDGRCSVYAERPQGCRVYPLVLDGDGRLVRDVDCPFRDEFPLDPAAKRRISRIVLTLDREAGRRGQA